MTQIGDAEIKTQNRIIRFFQDCLNYSYLGNLHDLENKNIRIKELTAWLLRQGYSETLARRAVDDLVKPINVPFGIIAFIALCNFPDWVR